MNNLNKKYVYAAIAVVVVVAIGIGVYFQMAGNKNKPGNGDGLSQNGLESLEPGTGAPLPDNASTTGGTGTKKLSYGDAIKAYPYRFQFVNCSANPGTMSVKKNSPVMLDNRDKTAHTIKVSGQSIRIAPYDYQILYARTEGISVMTCDGGGSARLNVEK
ncbi:MAG: hypothetical protein HY918_04855 [Candidatus Doudnabacteria bacterium]|nr:hypothetical protein [Candidatus Doudnabacteria bacterium]